MTDFSADAVDTSVGGVLTARTGSGSGDTVPAGAFVLARNTGAGSLTITLTNGATQDGLTVANRTHVLAAGAVRGFRVNPAYGDVNGRVPLAVTTGTAVDLTYYVSNA